MSLFASFISCHSRIQRNCLRAKIAPKSRCDIRGMLAKLWKQVTLGIETQRNVVEPGVRSPDCASSMDMRSLRSAK